MRSPTVGTEVARSLSQKVLSSSQRLSAHSGLTISSCLVPCLPGVEMGVSFDFTWTRLVWSQATLTGLVCVPRVPRVLGVFRRGN